MTKKEYVPQRWSELSANYLGHDTEFFLETTQGRVVPSFEFFKQKDEEPTFFLPQGADLAAGVPLSIPENLPSSQREWLRRIPAANFQLKAFRDGLAVEFNAVPETCRGFLWNDQVVATNMASWRLPKGVRFTTKPVMRVTSALVKTFPEDLKVLGCSPTQDAYTGTLKDLKGVNPLKLPFRTSGAHLHMSFYRIYNGDSVSNLPVELWSPFIKMADLLIGVPFTYVFGDELEFKRRTLYGTAGEFRRQVYPSGAHGLEYRVLSSRLWNHPMTFSLFTGIWKYVLGSGSRLQALLDQWDPAWEPDIQAAINTGDEVSLKKLLTIGSGMLHRANVTAIKPYLHNSYGIILPNSEETAIKVWAGLRKWRKMGKLDTFALMEPSIPEGHYGWQHYSSSPSFGEVVRDASL